MSKNEKITDFFIGKLLSNAKIDFTPNSSNIKEIQTALKTASKKGTGRAGFPEFTAKSKEFILVVEDKASLENQANYKDEEQTILAIDKKSIINFAENGALHYANEIIAKTSFKKLFAFGCSGNEKHHTIRPIYVDSDGYKIMQPVENFENFSATNIEKYYKEQVLGVTPPEILETEEIIKKAKILHEHLRNYGQLGDDEKPLVVSAILLALCDKNNFNSSNLTGDKINTDGNKIFSSIDTYMKRVEVTPDTKKEKVLNQFNIIKDRNLLNVVDERLAKTPLRFFTEFLEENVLASVKANAKEDILGMFYGEFIRFSGGDGQTLGVVLTPGHITELFCELVDLKPTDIVFDPCCGTSGFLIAALHNMLRQVKTKKEQNNIKKNQLHGIEIREDMFSIATTNMILRGDGKSNLENKDFLKQPVEDLKIENEDGKVEIIEGLRAKKYTVGFMNPPYSQAKGKDTAHLSEIRFIEHLLDSLADGARTVVIVPQSTMVGKTKEDKQVKKRILEKHTLEGVITLNKETFYGIGTNPCLALFTAHKPHSEKKFCKFFNYEDDGFAVRKHVGLVETERAKSQKSHLLNCWLHDAPAESKFMVKTTIESDDEWLHSFYYFNDEIPKAEDFEKTIADYLTFEFGMIAQGKSYLFENQE
ncbi:MAG: SAM-dependent methyltransferase [Cyclobacteriaceae bacterium]|nr:SAM-dependent methyltransferase [Cyclobacteriaceae bacterium]